VSAAKFWLSGDLGNNIATGLMPIEQWPHSTDRSVDVAF
jgi:hypothetical protein